LPSSSMSIQSCLMTYKRKKQLIYKSKRNIFNLGKKRKIKLYKREKVVIEVYVKVNQLIWISQTKLGKKATPYDEDKRINVKTFPAMIQLEKKELHN